MNHNSISTVKLTFPSVVLFTLLFGFKTTSAQQQISAQLNIIDDSGELIRGCAIKMFEEDELIDQMNYSKAKVKLDLKLERLYVIEVKKDGYVTERVAFDTHLEGSELFKDRVDFFIRMNPSSETIGLDSRAIARKP